MSRNLLRDDCVHCGDMPRLLEPPRSITEADAGDYFEEYEGMQVAHAACPSCCALYLAWVDNRTRKRRMRWFDARWTAEGQTHFDLSYRSTFDNEPGPTDLPQYLVERVVTFKRLGPFVRP